ncbi:unnamed protein product [Ilex paraguariensis]|uniref:Uncharacterized protein n=1 Tax=Ilex paraguariensis TaxID=185542 RepID=A0ABC8T7L8_9AQUA
MCTLRCSSCFNVSPDMTGNASHQQQHQMGSSQIQAHQCAPSHSQPYQPHQSKHHQSHSNACECQLSQPESGTHIGVAGMLCVSALIFTYSFLPFSLLLYIGHVDLFALICLAHRTK